MDINLSSCGNGKGENLVMIDNTIDGDVESYEERENMEFLIGIRYNLGY